MGTCTQCCGNENAAEVNTQIDVLNDDGVQGAGKG